MSIFYAKSTGGFYDTDINGADIPVDALEISAEQHDALLAEQSQGKVIIPGEDGYPYAAEPVVSDEVVAGIARAQRDARLSACDWVVLRSFESGIAPTADWLEYRQALRDLPIQAGFPRDIDWPEAPNA